EKPSDKIFLIPLKLDECEIPDLQIPSLSIRLRDIQWLDYWNPNGWEQLNRAIQRAATGSPPSPSAAPPQPIAESPNTKPPSPANLRMILVASAILLTMLAFGIFLPRTSSEKNSASKTSAPAEISPAETITIECDPSCTRQSDFALRVTYDGAPNLSGTVALGVLLPDSASLVSWDLASPNLKPPDPKTIPSGTGVTDYRSGDLFTLLAVRGQNPIDFNTVRRLSSDVGVPVAGYRLFAFKLGDINSKGESIYPITFSNFRGALRFPAGTIFFAFLHAKKTLHIPDQTALTALVTTR